MLIAKSVRVYRRNGRNPRFLSLPSSLLSQITDYSLIIYIGSKNSKLRNTGEVELVEHDEGIDVKERVYFCEILVSTMTQDTSPRTEGSGDENTDLSSSRRTRRNTSRRDQRIPNLFGLTARISGFLEISLSLSSKAWEKTLNRTSDFDNCLRELGKTGRETTSVSKRNAYFSTPDAARQR